MSITATNLQRSRDAFVPALRAALDRLDETSRAQAAYHLGFADTHGRPVTAGGGKAIRPTLALLSAEAAGAPGEIGLPGAVAVELVHNFSLLHDDLMDHDTQRRHRRTVWAVWGPAAAILTGDALLALATEVLLETGAPTAGLAAHLLSTATRDLIRGQVQDLAFEHRPRVDLDECLDMAAGKTGALLSASAAIGAVLAGAPDPTVSALAAFGAQLGVAFQLVDDILGIWGDPAVTGKPVHSDLRARKKSLPVTYTLAHGGAAGRELAAWLATDQPTTTDQPTATDQPTQTDQPTEAALRRAADLVAAGGGRDWAVREAAHRTALAVQALDGSRICHDTRDGLVALAQFMINREA